MVTKAHDMLNVSDFQTKAVTFCRISSKDQEKGVSIEAQIQNVKSYCTAHNLSIIREFAITESSIQGDRKQYHQMIQFIKSKKEKIAIVCNCVDRLQRSYKDTPELDTLRREGKIEVHFIKESLVLNKDSNGMSILFWNLNVLMANSYILSLSDNVKRSMKYNLANGKWQWKTPVAYLNKTSTDGKAYIELDQEKAKLVRKLFCDFSTGDFSITQLTQRAQQIGLTNNENQVISRSTIHRILTNPFYYGFMQIEKGTKIVPHIHGKIISKELFDKCQEILGNKSTKSRMNKKIFAFSGLLTCGTCGCVITPEQHIKKSGKEFIYLKCHHSKKHIHCEEQPVREEILMAQLEEELFSQITPAKVNKFNKYIGSIIKQEMTTLNNIRTQLMQEKTKLEAEKSQFMDLLVSNQISQADYAFKLQRINESISNIDNKIVLNSSVTPDLLKELIHITQVLINLSRIIVGSKVVQKRLFLKWLLLNPVLTNKKLQISAVFPINFLINIDSCLNWQEELYKIITNSPNNLLDFINTYHYLQEEYEINEPELYHLL